MKKKAAVADKPLEIRREEHDGKESVGRVADIYTPPLRPTL